MGLCLMAMWGCVDGCIGLMRAWWLCLRWVEDVRRFASKDGERGEWSLRVCLLCAKDLDERVCLLEWVT